MKNLIIILVILLGFKNGNAQEFISTAKYTIAEDIQDKGQDYEAYQVHLVTKEKASEKLATFTINDPELFEMVQITTLDNPGLEGVTEIVKVEVEYLGCCAHVEAYYFLATATQGMIALPRLENVYCDTSSTAHYTFPNQEYGVVNTILNTEALYNELGEIKYVKLKQSYAWMEDDFDNNSIAGFENDPLDGFDQNIANHK